MAMIDVHQHLWSEPLLDALALDDPDPADVDRALERGCARVSLPAGALAGLEAIARLRPLLAGSPPGSA